MFSDWKVWAIVVMFGTVVFVVELAGWGIVIDTAIQAAKTTLGSILHGLGEYLDCVFVDKIR